MAQAQGQGRRWRAAWALGASARASRGRERRSTPQPFAEGCSHLRSGRRGSSGAAEGGAARARAQGPGPPHRRRSLCIWATTTRNCDAPPPLLPPLREASE